MFCRQSEVQKMKMKITEVFSEFPVISHKSVHYRDSSNVVVIFFTYFFGENFFSEKREKRWETRKMKLLRTAALSPLWLIMLLLKTPHTSWADGINCATQPLRKQDNLNSNENASSSLSDLTLPAYGCETCNVKLRRSAYPDSFSCFCLANAMSVFALLNPNCGQSENV